jgi:metal-responsive CopG/Arc/MetJ family transcriptional regulator
MKEPTVKKITISLRQDLVDLADRLARERSTSRSGVIAELLQKEARALTEALMEEGYREMAEENRRLAEEAFPVAGDLLARTTAWDEEPRG